MRTGGALTITEKYYGEDYATGGGVGGASAKL
jgi:hypothetical protein